MKTTHYIDPHDLHLDAKIGSLVYESKSALKAYLEKTKTKKHALWVLSLEYYEQ